jgi:uncharacterized protein VirK/YbjX
MAQAGADRATRFEGAPAFSEAGAKAGGSMLLWAWRASKHAGSGLKMRLKFILAAARAPQLSRKLASAKANSPFGALLAECPETVGTLLWPYQCAAWDAETRFNRISAHVDAIANIPGLDLALGDKLVLADLSSISPGVSLIIDRAPWLAREGHLALSLFKGDFRAFSVAFSLFAEPEPALFIGCVQGRQSDDILALYRDLTKDFEGMRPRDFLLEALRLFALRIGVRHIYAVADEHKITRHKYFAGKTIAGIRYDDVWEDRGGSRVATTHYELPLDGSRRSLEEIPAKKRSMYRRRYDMLDAIDAAMPADLTRAELRHFDAL